MPAPQPLIQTPAPNLDWSRPGTPAATDFGDVYFSTDGGLEETRDVFLRGCGLPEGWHDRPVFTIAELGFGSGLNFLATWQLWTETATAGQRLHYVSIEKYPFDRAQLVKALAAFPELSTYSAALTAAWPGRVKGLHRLHFGKVTLTLVHDGVMDALDSLQALRADAWFLDGFSPRKNPDMWAEDLMARLPELCADGARLATFSVAAPVRQALQAAGFELSKKKGFGRKRHRLEARLPGASSPTSDMGRALIIGAGIAGRSLAHALQRRSIDFDIIDSGDHPAASGNPAALIKPRLDLQDRPESRFFLAAYLYALQAYAGAEIHRGVRHLPKSDKDAARFQALADQAALGDGHLRWADGALHFDSALTIAPDRVLPVKNIRPETADAAMARGGYSHVFLAAGYGIRTLAPDVPLRFSRGQLTWAQGGVEAGVEAGLDVSEPISYGGYALPMGGKILVGATHDRLDDGDPFELREADDARNLSGLAEVTGLTPKLAQHPSRASVRVTTADTLPRVLDLGDNRWAVTGLGSRGFVFAPLLAEALISHICAEPLPIARQVFSRFKAL